MKKLYLNTLSIPNGTNRVTSVLCNVSPITMASVPKRPARGLDVLASDALLLGVSGLGRGPHCGCKYRQCSQVAIKKAKFVVADPHGFGSG